MATLASLKKRYRNNEIGERSGNAELANIPEFKNASNAQKRKIWMDIFGSSSKKKRTTRQKSSGNAGG